jgi:hypothetical protein
MKFTETVTLLNAECRRNDVGIQKRRSSTVTSDAGLLIYRELAGRWAK